MCCPSSKPRATAFSKAANDWSSLPSRARASEIVVGSGVLGDQFGQFDALFFGLVVLFLRKGPHDRLLEFEILGPLPLDRQRGRGSLSRGGAGCQEQEYERQQFQVTHGS